MNRTVFSIVIAALICSSSLQAYWHDQGPYMYATDKIAIGSDFYPAEHLHIKGADAKIRVQGTTAGAIQLYHDNLGFEWQTHQNRIRLNKLGCCGDIFTIRDYSNIFKVGIGTSNPSLAKLQLVSSVGSNGIMLETTSNGSCPFLTWKDYGSSALDKYSIRYNGNLRLLAFGYGDESGHTPQMVIDATNGRLGIGTVNPGERLEVNGKIKCHAVKINNWTIEAPDYVFEENYSLPSLDKVEASIKANKHLPEIPSAAEMKEKGVDLSEMNMMLLKKVEELTLYVIEQNKKIESLEKKVDGE